MSELTNKIEDYFSDMKFLNQGREIRTSLAYALLGKALKELYRVDAELHAVSHDRGLRAIENDKLRLEVSDQKDRIDELEAIVADIQAMKMRDYKESGYPLDVEVGWCQAMGEVHYVIELHKHKRTSSAKK